MTFFFWFLRQPGKVGLNFGFEVVKELFNGRENIVGKKIVNLDSVKKAINDEDVSDDTLPYAGYKTHLEESYAGDLFLAFRCPASQPSEGLCLKLPYE